MSKLDDSWLQITREGGYNFATGKSEPLEDTYQLVAGTTRHTAGKTVARGSFAACCAVARLYDNG